MRAIEPGNRNSIIWFPSDLVDAEKVSEVTKWEKKTLADVIREDLASGKEIEQVARSKGMTVEEVKKYLGGDQKMSEKQKVTLELLEEYLEKLGVEEFSREQLEQIARETENKLRTVSILAGKLGLYSSSNKKKMARAAETNETQGNVLTTILAGEIDQILGAMDGVKSIVFALNKSVKIEIRVSEID